MSFIPQNARAYSFCGIIEYMAPEIVKGGSQGHDMVSLASPVCPVVQQDVWHGPVDISDGPRPENTAALAHRFFGWSTGLAA